MMELLFYIALIVATATIFIVAVKGFIELMAPVKAARREASAAKIAKGKS